MHTTRYFKGILARREKSEESVVVTHIRSIQEKMQAMKEPAVCSNSKAFLYIVNRPKENNSRFTR